MPEARIDWVIREDKMFGRAELWQKTMEFGFIPAVGDSIDVLFDEDDEYTVDVKRRYWKRGVPVIELKEIRVRENTGTWDTWPADELKLAEDGWVKF